MIYVLLIVSLLSACISKDSATIAKVNGEPISIGDFKNRLREIQFDQNLMGKDELTALKKTVLNELIETKIIQQQSRKLDITVTQEELDRSLQSEFSEHEMENINTTLEKQRMTRETWNDRMKQKIMAEKLFQNVTQTTPEPSPEEIDGYYQKNIQEFQQTEQVRIQQIVLQTKEEAQQVMAHVKQNEDFTALAKAHSMRTDGTTGGDMGFIPKGLLPENIEKTVFSMKSGTVSPIIESPTGYYIIKVVDKKEQKTLTLEESRQQIQTMLLQKAKDAQYTKWIQDRMLEAKIKRNYEILQDPVHP